MWLCLCLKLCNERFHQIAAGPRGGELVALRGLQLALNYRGFPDQTDHTRYSRKFWYQILCSTLLLSRNLLSSRREFGPGASATLMANSEIITEIWRQDNPQVHSAPILSKLNIFCILSIDSFVSWCLGLRPLVFHFVTNLKSSNSRWKQWGWILNKQVSEKQSYRCIPLCLELWRPRRNNSIFESQLFCRKKLILIFKSSMREFSCLRYYFCAVIPSMFLKYWIL